MKEWDFEVHKSTKDTAHASSSLMSTIYAYASGSGSWYSPYLDVVLFLRIGMTLVLFCCSVPLFLFLLDFIQPTRSNGKFSNGRR